MAISASALGGILPPTFLRSRLTRASNATRNLSFAEPCRQSRLYKEMTYDLDERDDRQLLTRD